MVDKKVSTNKAVTFGNKATCSKQCESSDKDYLESDDDEGPINNIGFVPPEWYKYEEHCGYDKDGHKVLKPSDITELRKFLSSTDDDYRTIRDQFGNVLTQLTDKDIELIERITKWQYPNENYDPEAVFVEFDKSDGIFPVRNPIYRKDSFLPSKYEYKIIKRILACIRKRGDNVVVDKPNGEVDDIWKDSVYTATDKENRRIVHELAAPKMPLPKSDESYNPPSHLIPDAGEINDERRYIPKKYDSLRTVPAYKYYLIERFERCMDLYLCPRASRVKMNIDIKALLASVPKMEYDQLAHDICLDYLLQYPANIARIENTGRYVAIVSGGFYLQIFSLLSGRCCFIIDLSGDKTSINDIAWHPHLPVLAIAQGPKIIMMAIDFSIESSVDDDTNGDYTFNMQNGFNAASNYILIEKTKRCILGDVTIRWKRGISAKFDENKAIGFTIHHNESVIKLNFNLKGSFLAAIMFNGTRMSDQVIMHSVTKKSSMFLNANVSNIKVNHLLFHPANPQLILGTSKGLMLANLNSSKDKTKAIKKISGLSEVLSLNLSGNILIASGDHGAVSLYNMEYPETPFKTFSFPNIKCVIAHQRLPLVYIAQENGKINVFYIKIDEDESINVVPCKQINIKCKMKLMDLALHPSRPWFLSATNEPKCLLYA